MKSLTDKNYWEAVYTDRGHGGLIGLIRRFVSNRNRIDLFLNKYLPHTQGNKSVLEVGCYPGRYLEKLAMRGYLISGIDFVDKVDELRTTLNEKGLKIGRIIKGNFLTHKFSESYDAVVSFGFVEHFENYGEIIQRHADLCYPGGLVIITAPNLNSPFQKLMREKYAPRKIKYHNFEAVNIEAWKNCLCEKGLEIVYCGYFGTCFVLTVDDSISRLKLLFFKAIYAFLLCLPTFFDPKSLKLSAYAGIVARKKYFNDNAEQ